MLAALITASTDDADGRASSMWIVPLTSVKRPFTVVIIKCFAANSTRVCAGSSVQVLLVSDRLMVEVVMVFLLCKARFDAGPAGAPIPSSLKAFCRAPVPARAQLACTARYP